MFGFIQIAENSERLTKEFKLNHHDIPWKEIKGMKIVLFMTIFSDKITQVIKISK